MQGNRSREGHKAASPVAGKPHGLSGHASPRKSGLEGFLWSSKLDPFVQRSVRNLRTRDPSQLPPWRRDVFESDRSSLRRPASLGALGSPSEAMGRRWGPVSTSPSVVLASACAHPLKL